jgi:hypothetical protein
VAIKQNLPVIAGFGLLVVGLVALVLFLRRPDEELVREAAATYAATLGPVKSVQVHGTIADIEVSNRRLLHAEFTQQGGAWVFSKDLGQDFERMMQHPSTSADVLRRLAQRIADRMNLEVVIKDPPHYQYSVARDAQGLVGQVLVLFAYPKIGETQRSGRYLETFRYADGKWQSQGVGALYDQMAAPKR